MTVEGEQISGLSIGGLSTSIWLPERSVCFDLGKSPMTASFQDLVCITHGHLDHVGGLPFHIAQRGLHGVKPATYLVPKQIHGHVRSMLESFRMMSKTRFQANIIPIGPGERYNVPSRRITIKAFKTKHNVHSQGYIVASSNMKLKPQYYNAPKEELKAKRIEYQLRFHRDGPPPDGEDQWFQTKEENLVAFTGDTNISALVNPPNEEVLTSKVLITEATFLAWERDIRRKQV
eukprot:CAMPEP_0175974618 /NCGR_PEP_ID=MMETSP0108-20121206/43479_1 /TAXON_ID=195067 ORGANISM="Goniomonas pacifica, Strain CCMP1869" /NCGR_SAMPLE_ID=MMETSP0108 /ASSEMBLY_ACC=CAM_ASM_000204 /LENGTH=232 /DNA_ID=CAMNT_0017304255 /DNA_START=84 /DNA_END=782 /DNA_ORIENTATION=-